MNKKQIEKLIGSHYKTIKVQAGRIAGNADAADIHRLRVAYKKLRSHLRLFTFNGQNYQQIKALKKLRRFYKVAGATRELQLQQQFITDAVKATGKKTKAYFILLQNQILIHKKKLAELSVKKITSTSKAVEEMHLPNQFGKNKFTIFFKAQKNAVEQMIAAGNFSDNNIHFIRKKLKDLFYNLNIYRRYHAKVAHPGIKKIIKQYEILLKELGDFHDQCTAIALLQPLMLKTINNTNRQILQQVKKSWLKQKQMMKKELVNKLKAEIIKIP